MGLPPKRLTQDDKDAIIALAGDYTISEICQRLHFNPSTVRKVIAEFHQVKTKKEEGVKRRCLKCGNMFPSMSKGNRICPKCKTENDRTFSMNTTNDLTHRGGRNAPSNS